MIDPNQKGYYEDYLRKQNTTRAMVDPPVLLTDRSAYVNFLEVQLERVSSACMNVAAYDQRFNDMQNLIVALEERCANTTKLVSLAQKCTEEVRGEMDSKIDSLVGNVSDENKKLKEALSVVAGRISDAEITLADYSVLPSRLGNAEARISEAEETARNAALQSLEEAAVANNRLEELESGRISMAHTIDGIEANLSRQNKIIEQNDARLHSLVNSVETRLQELQTRDRQEIEMKLDNVDFEFHRSMDVLDDKIKDCHSTISQQKQDQAASLAHQAVKLRADFTEMQEKQSESIKASLNKLTSQMYKELDEAHEAAEALEKRVKDRERVDEKQFEKAFGELKVCNARIEVNEESITKNSDKIAALQPVLQALATQQKNTKHLAELTEERSGRLETRVDGITGTVKALGIKSETTDRKLDYEHKARLLAQRLQQEENARIMHAIEEEGEKLAEEHRERLEHEHLQKVLDDKMLAKLDEEAAQLAEEHKNRLEQQHMQSVLDQNILQKIADEAEALKGQHMERLQAEAHQRAIDDNMRHSIEKEAADLAREHKERTEHEILQKELDVRIQFEIKEQAEQLAREHSEKLEFELKQKAINKDMQHKIDVEAAALAAEHKERLVSEARLHEEGHELEAQIQAKIDEESLKIEKEHKERLESEEREKAVDQEMRNAIDREHQQIARFHRERLESETRLQRIDEDMQNKINDEANKLQQEHIVRLEEERKRALFTEEVLALHEKEAGQIAAEHRERKLEEHRQAAMNEKVRKDIAIETEKFREEHRQRLEAEARQEAMDTGIRSKIADKARLFAKEYKERRKAQQSIIFEQNTLKNEIGQVEEVLTEEKLEQQRLASVQEQEREKLQRLTYLAQAHEQAQQRTQLLRERHLEAQIAQNVADMTNIMEQIAAAEGEEMALARAVEDANALIHTTTGRMPIPKVVYPQHVQAPTLAIAPPPVPAEGRISLDSGPASVNTLNQAMQKFISAGRTKIDTKAAAVGMPHNEEKNDGAQSSYDPPHSPGRASVTSGRSRPSITIPATTRAAHLRKATSHSPSRSNRNNTQRSRRQRLRAEALEASAEASTGGEVISVVKSSNSVQNRSVSSMSRKEQIARDNARSYLLHEQQVQDIQAGIPNLEPNPTLLTGAGKEGGLVKGELHVRLHPATAIPIAAGGLNTSFNTSISGISDTMITYDGQPAKTRFLNPYFGGRFHKGRRGGEGGEEEGEVDDEQLVAKRNRGLYGEGLWLPNSTSLPPSVPVGSPTRRVQFGVGGSSELTRDAVKAVSEAAIAQQVANTLNSSSETAAGLPPTSKSSTGAAAVGVSNMRGLVTQLMEKMDQGRGGNSDATSTTTTTSQPTVEVEAERPHRANIAPQSHMRGSAAQVTRLAHTRKQQREK